MVSRINSISNQGVFDKFKQLDFTSRIGNPKGEVEIVINLLGDEVTKMLKGNLDQANDLQSRADQLKSFVANLNEGAKSLGEIEANVNILSQSINEMSQSISEQTVAINQINEAVVNVDSLTRQNT